MCFKPRFMLLCWLNYYRTLQKHSFRIAFSDILSKLATVIFPLCFKKQTLELLLYLSLQTALFINPDVKKLFWGDRTLLSYLGLNSHNFSHKKAIFFHIRSTNSFGNVMRF